MEKRTDKKNKLALLISWTIHPMSSFFFITWSAYNYFDTTVDDMLLVLSPFFTITITYVVVAVFILNHTDIEFSDIKKRPPLLVTMVIGMFLSLLVSRSITPVLDPFLIRFLVILTIAAVITFAWKISIHALFFTMMVVMLTITVSYWFSLLVVLLPPLYWSRIYLHKHKYWQLFAGSLLSLILLL